MRGRFKNSCHGRSVHGRRGAGRQSWNKGFENLGQGLYRSRSGVVMGVCQGVGERFDLPVFWVRVAVVVLLFASGFWPVIGLYLLAAFTMKPEPVTPIESEEEGDFYNNYVTSRKAALRALNTRFKTLERKILRLEDAVTSREFDWDEKL